MQVRLSIDVRQSGCGWATSARAPITSGGWAVRPSGDYDGRAGWYDGSDRTDWAPSVGSSWDAGGPSFCAPPSGCGSGGHKSVSGRSAVPLPKPPVGMLVRPCASPFWRGTTREDPASLDLEIQGLEHPVAEIDEDKVQPALKRPRIDAGPDGGDTDLKDPGRRGPVRVLPTASPFCRKRPQPPPGPPPKKSAAATEEQPAKKRVVMRQTSKAPPQAKGAEEKQNTSFDHLQDRLRQQVKDLKDFLQSDEGFSLAPTEETRDHRSDVVSDAKAMLAHGNAVLERTLLAQKKAKLGKPDAKQRRLGQRAPAAAPAARQRDEEAGPSGRSRTWKQDPRDRRRVKRGQGGPGRTAYVVVLWAPANQAGDAIEKSIADALVLGQSLARHNSSCSRILLATSDLLQAVAAGMLSFFWEVRETKYINVPRAHVSKCNARFRGVFTKLQAWGLDEFSRVALLDSDLLACRDIDEIMSFCNITALMRGDADWRPGEKRARDTLYGPAGRELRGGVNGGVIVLAPSRRTLRNMRAALWNHMHRSYPQQSGAPEQDFITRYFDRTLHSLHRKYNFQLHQLSKAGERAEPGSELDILITHPDKIAIWHYSSEQKPRDIVFSSSAQTKEKWMTDFTAKHWTKEQRTNGLPNDRTKSVIEKAVDAWIKEWGITWEASLERCMESAACGEDGVCPACGARMDLQHCYFACERVQPLAAEWRNSCCDSAAGLDHLLRTPTGKWVVPSMRFVGSVLRAWTDK